MQHRATCGNSEWEGIFRAEPKDGSVLKAVGLSCLKQIAWPWKEAVAEVISHDPDLVIFAGDQIYENDYGSRAFYAKTQAEVPQGMKNYFEKYRKFGEAFRVPPLSLFTDPTRHHRSATCRARTPRAAQRQPVRRASA